MGLVLARPSIHPSGRRTPGSDPAVAASSATFTPQHPLVLISGGVAEQLPPGGVPLPPGEQRAAQGWTLQEPRHTAGTNLRTHMGLGNPEG